jgi:uncharacterized protein with PQ loop repeat
VPWARACGARPEPVGRLHCHVHPAHRGRWSDTAHVPELPDFVVLAGTVVAGVLGLFFAAPQLWRTFTTKSTAGLSVVGYANGTVSYAAWTMYFVSYGRHLVALSVAVPGVLWVATLVLLATYRHREGERVVSRRLLLPATWFSIVVGVRLVNESWFDVVLSTSVLWAYLPAVWTVWRAVDVSGVSSTSWLLSGAHSIAVLVAGWPLVASVLYGSFGAATAGVVVAIVSWRTKRPPPDVIAAPAPQSDLHSGV